MSPAGQASRSSCAKLAVPDGRRQAQAAQTGPRRQDTSQRRDRLVGQLAGGHGKVLQVQGSAQEAELQFVQLDGSC